MPYAPKHIIVVESGWVFSGDVTDKGEHITIDNAAVIRQWGTTEGLGELCLKGPTDNTVLDYCTAPAVPKSKILFTLPVASGVWYK
jgi:hypothetical protein